MFCGQMVKFRRRSDDPEEAFAQRTADFVAHAQRAGAVSVICVVIYVFTNFGGYFWPMWVLLAMAIKLGAHARSLYGRPLPADR